MNLTSLISLPGRLGYEAARRTIDLAFGAGRMVGLFGGSSEEQAERAAAATRDPEAKPRTRRTAASARSKPARQRTSSRAKPAQPRGGARRGSGGTRARGGSGRSAGAGPGSGRSAGAGRGSGRSAGDGPGSARSAGAGGPARTTAPGEATSGTPARPEGERAPATTSEPASTSEPAPASEPASASEPAQPASRTPGAVGSGDVELIGKVQAEVLRDIEGTAITVDVNPIGGVVRLSGRSTGADQVRELQRRALAVPGVKRVENELLVPDTPAPGPFHAERHDADAEPLPTELADRGEGRQPAPLGAGDDAPGGGDPRSTIP